MLKYLCMIACMAVSISASAAYYDDETGMMDNINRTLRTVDGRYTQPDPVGHQGGLNRYGYVGANPLNKIDPLGLYECGPGYSAVAVADRVWKCVPNGSDPNRPICVTGECSGGLLPTRKPNPSACEEQCGLGSDDAGGRAVACSALTQAGKLVGMPGIPVTLTCKAADKYACVKKCEEDRGEQTCKR